MVAILGCESHSQAGSASSHDKLYQDRNLAFLYSRPSDELAMYKVFTLYLASSLVFTIAFLPQQPNDPNDDVTIIASGRQLI